MMVHVTAAMMFFEVMDKEPPLAFIFLYFQGFGALGMLAARRRATLAVPFIAVVLLADLVMYLELRDAFVGPAILEEGGVTYLTMLGFATVLGIGLPALGAVWGAKNLPRSLAIWRLTLGLTGAVLSGLTLYGGYGFLKTAYYDYYVFPKLKAADHYIMPLRWQEIVAEVLIGSILTGLMILSVHLLRLALRTRLNARQSFNSNYRVGF